MAAADRFWERVMRRARLLQPEQVRAYHAAIEALKARLSTREVEALVASGAIAQAIGLALSEANLDAAFARFRAQMQLITRDATVMFGKDIPGVRASGIAILFTVLSPTVVEAVRALDTETMQGLKEAIRETVRQVIQRGLEQGDGPRTTARALREVLSLSPTQEEAIHNYRRALEGDRAAGDPLTRALRDRRFDAAIRRGPLSADQIEQMVDAYRRRMVAFNAETVARTATLDALKLGQHLAWEDAIAQGVVEAGALMKMWKGEMDDREREEHVAMEGETVPFDQPYSNGEDIPGESTYNCRCLSIVTAGAA